MIGALIGAIIGGAIIGGLGRAVLPGAQNIGWLKTIGLGIVASVIVGLVFNSAGWIISTILGALVAAGLLWVAIRQGWIKPTPA